MHMFFTRFMIFIIGIFLCTVNLFAQNVTLDYSGKHAILRIDGQPFFMRAGELHNSTCSDINYLNSKWDNLKGMNLNTVIATASWELLEPEEGRFDFSHVDAVIRGAEQHDLKVVLIWFATFKNPFMTYAPIWVKADNKRFPHAMSPDGNALELPSLYDDNILEADKKAYLTLLNHIKEVDTKGTVIAMQIGNEPGLNSPTRDCSIPANRAWEADVPTCIIDYLVKHRKTLQPDIKGAWENNGCKRRGNWEEVFGKSLTADDGTNPILYLTENLFTAYGSARYLEALSSAGKEVLDLPTFTNATGTVNARGRSMGNGCSVPEFFDIYMAVAPSLDMLTPNSYGQNFDEICEAFSYNSNPLLIPECTMSAVRPFYLLGEWNGLGYSPFRIDDYHVETPAGKLLADAYALLDNMESIVSANLNSERMRGIFIHTGKPVQEIEMGDYVITFNHEPTNEIGETMMRILGGEKTYEEFLKRKKEIPPFEAAALIIQTGKDEFYIAGGGGINATFRLKENRAGRFCDFDYIYEGTVNKDGEFVKGRLLNGDEQAAFIRDKQIGIIKVKLYHF